MEGKSRGERYEKLWMKGDEVIKEHETYMLCIIS